MPMHTLYRNGHCPGTTGLRLISLIIKVSSFGYKTYNKGYNRIILIIQLQTVFKVNSILQLRTVNHVIKAVISLSIEP